MSDNESGDFLLGAAIPSAKFPAVGATITGTIVEPPVVRDQTDPASGEVKKFDNGDTMKTLVVTLQTTERDPEVDDDEGLRRLYVKGSKNPESKSMTAALGTAVKAAKAKGLEVGGIVTVTYTGDGVQEKRGLNAPKQFTATYTPPSVQASADYLGAAEPVQETIPVASTPAPAAAAPAVETAEDKIRKLIAAGIDDTTIATAVGVDPAVVTAIRNPAPAAAAPNPAELAKTLIAAGADDATIATATGLDVNVVAALRLT